MAFEKGKWVLQQAQSGGRGQGNSAFLWMSGCLCCRDRGQAGWMGSLLCWTIALLYPKAKQRPLVTWKMGAQTVRHLRIWSRKMSRESPCRSGAGKTREPEAEVHQPYSLCAQTASALPVSSRCLPTAQCRGRQVTRETSSPAAPAACHSVVQTRKADETPCFPKH